MVQGKLEGKVAIITGAAAGLGEGIAETYVKYGAKICMVDLDPNVDKTAERIRGIYPDAQIITVVANVADKQQMIDAAAKTKEAFGSLDVACCNAGVCRLAPFEEMTDETRDFHIDVNIKGIWNTTRAVLPVMIENGYGKIVNMSSVTGPLVADEGETAYAMSKAAIYGFTKALARETAKYKINVNMIMPGYVMTPMAQSIAVQSCPEDPDSVIRGIESGVPLGRLADPKEVGHLAAFLASDDAAYLTGTQVVIDGGSTLPETVSVGA